MRRGGSVTLANVLQRSAPLCEPCGDRSQYRVERLMAAHGDTKLATDLLEHHDWPKLIE